MRKFFLFSVIILFCLIITGCVTKPSLEDIDSNQLLVTNFIFDDEHIILESTIGDNKEESSFFYGVEISLIDEDNNELLYLNSNVKKIDKNKYITYFKLDDIPTSYYGEELTSTPYIKYKDDIIYGSTNYSFTLLNKALKAKAEGKNFASICEILEFANENMKKIYSSNGVIYIDNPLYEYDQIKLGKLFLEDWNKKYNTSYESFNNFVEDNIGNNTYYGTFTEISEHKLYKFFNDSEEMLVKYDWLFEVICSLDINSNFTKSQISIIKNINKNIDKYEKYYGFYHLLANIEACFSKKQIINTNFSYSTYNYSNVNAYLKIKEYFNNSDYKIYNQENYDYCLINEKWAIKGEGEEKLGKTWKGFILNNRIYQNNDLIDITSEDIYLVSKYDYISYVIKFYDGENEIKSLEKKYNIASRNITLFGYAKYGYNFLGWYTTSDFQENSKVDIIKTGNTGDINLYARYEKKEYSKVEVSFDLNGGKWKNNEDDHQILQNPIELPVPQSIGCKFTGWLNSNDNKVYTSYPGYYDFNSNIKYTATWEVVDMTDKEKVEATYEELINYFENNKIVADNLEFITYNDFYKTNISYESLNEGVLSSTGILNRSYEPTTVTINFKISVGSESKSATFEFIIDGFKELNNIASTYVYSGYDKLTDEFFETMDVIFCAFVLIDIDGGFTGVDGLGNSINNTNKTYLKYMKTYVLPKAHAKGVRVVASIGGGGRSVDLAYEEIVKSEAKMNNLSKNIVDLINEYGFDGADIDWEIPDDPKSFSKLSEKVYTAVKENNPNHIVTAAIGGGKWQPPKYDLTISKKYLDYVNLMTYNMVGNSGYHHTALYKSSTLFDKENEVGHTLNTCSIEESVEIYRNNYGIEPSQIIIGAAFYGMKQKRSKTNENYGSWESDGTISYTKIKSNYLDNSSYDYFYDTNCEAPYILSKDKTIFISYDDPRSIKAKCEYIKNIGAAGIMYWQNGQDTTGDLVKAIKEGLNK